MEVCVTDGVLQWQVSTRRIVLGNQLQGAAVWIPEPRRVERLCQVRGGDMDVGSDWGSFRGCEGGGGGGA